MPGAGLEPACRFRAGDFKSPVYTISPPGPFSNSTVYYLQLPDVRLRYAI